MRALVVLLSLVLLPAMQRQWTEVMVIDGDPVMRGLPKDGIPAIDSPVFVSADQAAFMDDREFVIGVSDGTTAKAYSTWLLNGHEIVNDTIGSASIAVTW